MSDTSKTGIRIAVDGPAASGKGTLARALARALRYRYVDTGTLYRTVGLVAAREGIPLDDAPRLAQVARDLPVDFSWDGDTLRVLLGGEDVTALIRTEQAGSRASRVSALPEVRDALLSLQRGLAAEGGVVMDGRDIGTVVLPEAELKVYLDASLQERTRRRHAELRERGIEADPQELEQEIARRDRQDSQRSVAPLVRAPDAVYVDSTALTPQQMLHVVLKEARAREPSSPSGEPVDRPDTTG